MKKLLLLMLLVAAAWGCTRSVPPASLEELANKIIAVPMGAIADEMVLSCFLNALIAYCDTLVRP